MMARNPDRPLRPSAIRALLLEQHERLRVHLDATEDLADELRHGAAVRSDFRDAVTALLEALSEHNASEESLLEPLLRAGDAYGPTRVTRMHEEHVSEHALMRAALIGHDLVVIAENLPDLAETLRAHMEAEERTFLHAGVLRDPDDGGRHST
jgi:hypothetical protein